MPRYLRTSEVAQRVGVHPNTVRLYEDKGFLPSIPRSQSGYRLFTARHVDQMRLAHLALQWPYPPGGQEVVMALVRCAANGDLSRAKELAHRHLANIRVELARAEAAVEYLDRWAHGRRFEPVEDKLTIGQAASRLGATADQLRNWDRSGLLDVPRDPETGYRSYGPAEIGRLRVIRMLRQAGYSLMAILRMLRQLDAGETGRLREALDTPGEDEGIETVADRWLTTLAEQEKQAQAIIEQLSRMDDAARQAGANPP